MSPVFRHGRLRLYLLKLLDEAPRHGYEVIRLLQDRFLGVYAPSPGTIYPRLARLEEEGLVTHDEADGKKVYRITEKGREEIRARVDDLAELEEEITESVRDIAREVTQDVRDTVRNLREELTWAARDVRREEREEARDQGKRIREETSESARRARSENASSSSQAADENAPAGDRWPGEAPAQDPRDGPSAGGPGTAGGPGPAEDSPGATGEASDIPWGTRGRAGDRKREQRRGGRLEWPDWAAFQDWQSWAGWRERPGRRGWSGFGGFPGSSAPGSEEPGPEAPGPQPPGPRPRTGRGRPAGLDAGLFRDLERIAVEFARELRTAAWHTESVGENALSDLRVILEDTLKKVKDEVFGGTAAGSAAAGSGAAGSGAAGKAAGPADSAAPTGTEPVTDAGSDAGTVAGSADRPPPAGHGGTDEAGPASDGDGTATEDGGVPGA
jgi:DNA-binding PadR family transcriptional regulator